MSYIEQNLASDENLIAAARIHKMIFFPGIFFTILGAAFIPQEEASRLYYLISTHGLYAINSDFLSTIIRDWLLLLTSLSILFGILKIIQSVLRISGIEMGITSKRIYKKVGVLTTNTDEMDLGRLESINIDQSFIGKIFDYGYVYFNSTIYGTIVFPMVKKPTQIRKDALTTVEKFVKSPEEKIN